MIPNETSIARNGDRETINLLDKFLSAFFADDETIYIRAFKAKGAPDSPSNSPRKPSITRASLRDDPSVVRSLRELNEQRGLFFVVNSGGQKKSNITRVNSFFAESDKVSKKEQHRLLNTAPLKPSMRVETARSVHAYWLLDGDCSVGEWEHVQLRLIDYFNADKTIKDASRVMRLPGFDHLTYDTESGEVRRAPVKLVEFKPERRDTLATIRQAFAKAGNEPFETFPNKEIPPHVLDGEGRHKEMVSLAGTLRDRGLTTQEMLPTLRAVNAQRFVPPLAEEKLQQIANSVADLYEPSKAIGEPLKQQALTDVGNAERLIRTFGDVLRRDLQAKLWIAWKGKRWIAAPDDGMAMDASLQVPDLIIQEAAAAKEETAKKELLKHAIRSQSARAIEALPRLIKNRTEIHTDIEAFDVHDHLLNVLNGTIDLRTGEIRPHRKEDGITKLTRIEYEPNARAPLFESFLNRIFDGNQSLISFMQRVCGYAVTGETREQCMFILHGDGANGKSTLIEIIRAATGEYATHVRTEALMKHKNTSAGAASEDIAELRGARFVSAVETSVGQAFAEGLLKQVTGQDIIKARRLYSHNIEFRPTFKLFLACNAKPEIAGTDHAIWRRIHLIPFDVTIPKEERDREILNKLKTELSGILAWCVRGASEWYRQGLNVPDEVKRATERYKAEEDVLSEFIVDTCEVADHLVAPVSEIYMMFDTWCRGNGESVMNRKLFTQMMRARGLKQTHTQMHQGRVWRGIARRPLNSSAG